VSLIQSALASLANQAANWLVAGQEPQPLGLEHPNIAPYGSLYQTADGQQLMLAVGSDAQFAALTRLLDAPQLASDPRFAANAGRVRQREALQAELRPPPSLGADSTHILQHWLNFDESSCEELAQNGVIKG
ncbi:MAG TPA: CoA transferase, partial [Candidatus Obscuribacterales bacterium]